MTWTEIVQLEPRLAELAEAVEADVALHASEAF